MTKQQTCTYYSSQQTITRPKLRTLTAYGTLALSAAISANTLAQSSGALEEIIVTATKRAENLQDIPVAVSAMSADMLTSQGVFETTDLNRSMPNLQVSSPYGTSQPNFSIRGVGVGTEFNANAASPIGVYVDEVYQTFRSSHGQQFFDLERLEVVRGPQGTLYGRNTTGGAINIITRQPELQGTNGYVTAGYGNYDRTNFEGAVEFTPITDVLGIRLAGTYVDSDSYVENLWPGGGRDPGGHENYGFRGIVRYVPNEAVDLSLKIYATRSEGGLEIPFSQGQDGYDVNFAQSALGPLYQNPDLLPLLRTLG